jgi:PIN domain nuclease of toxin-antitoxin system
MILLDTHIWVWWVHVNTKILNYPHVTTIGP